MTLFLITLASFLFGCAKRLDFHRELPRETFPVRVIYLIPADQKRFPEYERAIKRCVEDVKTWYLDRTERTFKTMPLETIHSEEDWLTMRCGNEPQEREKGLEDRQYMPKWVESVHKAVGGWRPRTATWIFAQGGGGVACANLQGDFAGFAMSGDWVLEPISGVANPDGIPASLCEKKIFVTGGTPIGTTAHELGHSIGLHHPEKYENCQNSVMMAHWTYPQGCLLPHEILVLEFSPFTSTNYWDEDMPHVSYATADKVTQGDLLELVVEGAKNGDRVEFLFVGGKRVVKPDKITKRGITAIVPEEIGPGVVRLRRGQKRSNAVPVNINGPTPSRHRISKKPRLT